MKSNKDVMHIYAIRNKNNGKVYIGRTSDIEKRVLQHWQEKKYIIRFRTERNQIADLTPFEADLKDMGEEAFEVYALEANVPTNLARERENLWIEEYEANNPSFGYNKRMERRRRVKITEGKPPNVSKRGTEAS